MKEKLEHLINQGLPVRFVFGCISVTTVLVFSSLESFISLYRNHQLQLNDNHILLLLTALSSDTFIPFIAIVSVLPFSASYIDDLKTKFIRFLLFRTSYTTYLVKRIIMCYMLGGLMTITGILGAYYVFAFTMIPFEEPIGTGIMLVAELLERCLLIFMNSGFWAILGMTMSTVMESKYVVYASPFLFYYFLVIIYERYFPTAFLLYPREWINPSEKWPLESLGVIIYLGELTIIASIIFYCRGRRRLGQL